MKTTSLLIKNARLLDASAKIDAKDTVVPTTCKMNRPTM